MERDQRDIVDTNYWNQYSRLGLQQHLARHDAGVQRGRARPMAGLLVRSAGHTDSLHMRHPPADVCHGIVVCPDAHIHQGCSTTTGRAFMAGSPSSCHV